MKDIVLNGIAADSGQYLIDPLDLGELATRIRGISINGLLADRLSDSLQNEADPHLGLPFTVHPNVVAEAGWGLVFHRDESPEVRAAMMPLFEHRLTQIGNEKIVKLLTIQPGDDLPTWLARHGVAQGSIEPERVPFYLLLVGDPARIPFQFGHQLDVEYCVGRLHFDTAAEYTRYVDSVKEYENAQSMSTTREAVFWAPRHGGDAATQLSADQLVTPLFDGAGQQGVQPPKPSVLTLGNWRGRKHVATTATKQVLLDTLMPKNGAARPAFLFTASHGVGYPNGDARQRDQQGALLTQDWTLFNPIQAKHCIGAVDVTDEAQVHGLVAFHFACFGAGTPERDQFVHVPGAQPPTIAPSPFLARLPQRLLSHPHGGALACIGHVERAWGYSIATPGAGTQLLPFRNCIGLILAGQPVGFAIKDFNEKYASLSVTLAGLLQQIGFGVKVPDAILVSRWVERNDAEAYVVLGDPAVSLRVGDLH